MSVARSVLAENSRKLIEYFESNGWIQYKGSTKEGSCLVYAINEQIDHAGIPSKCLGCQTQQAICETIDPTAAATLNLIAWNDRPGRTKEEVLDVLRRTAERLEAEG